MFSARTSTNFKRASDSYIPPPYSKNGPQNGEPNAVKIEEIGFIDSSRLTKKVPS